MVFNEVFGLSYLDSVFSSIQVAIMLLHWSRIAAKPLYAPHVNTVSDRLGFCELGCEQLSVLTVLHAVVGSGRIFFWRFCGCGWFLQTALRFLIDPLILPHNGVLHGFLLCKLKISLSKYTDLLFRSVPCLKLQ